MVQDKDHPNWHQHSFRAMGCQMHVWLELEEAAQAQDLLYQAERLFAAAERRLTRFRPDSELSRLNARPGEWVTVSSVLWQVVQQAIWLAEETDGLYDPTVLAAVEAAGYTQSFDPFSRKGMVTVWPQADEELGGQWHRVELDASRHAICLPQGVRLDLGGIGKGYTAQQVVAYLKHWGACLVDAGGDVTAGDAPVGQPGWPVAILAPWTGDDQPPVTLFTLLLANGTIATSGIDYRWWRVNGRKNHHLIDPRTGLPAQTDAQTVSVLSASGMRAEAWATAALVAGVEAGLDQLLYHDLAAAFVTQSGEVRLTEKMAPFAAPVDSLAFSGEFPMSELLTK